MSDQRPLDLSGHVALVTGANHGIGAATAVRLATSGASVLITYLRIDDAPDPGTPESYRRARASDGGEVMDAIERAGGTARAMEVDLAEDRSAGLLFATAEAELGPVDILVNNASRWVATRSEDLESTGFDATRRAFRPPRSIVCSRWMLAPVRCSSARWRDDTSNVGQPGAGSSGSSG